MAFTKHTLKTASMSIGMIAGIALFGPVSKLDNMTGNILIPTFVFLMLFFTFCRVDVRSMRLSWLHLWLLLIQFIGALLVYYMMLPFGNVIAQGTMICVAAPIAMASVVIGGLLGGSIVTLSSYVLLCNIVTAFLAPLLLNHTGNGECTVWQILSRVMPLLLGPFVAGQVCRYFFKSATMWVENHPMVTFYIWIVSLVVISGRTTNFIVVNHTSSWVTEVSLTIISLVVCLTQFRIGNAIGRRYGDSVAGGQALGQKNTMLAIWLAQMFLSPLSCIAPTMYILWQNLVNSYQIYRKKDV